MEMYPEQRNLCPAKVTGRGSLPGKGSHPGKGSLPGKGCLPGKGSLPGKGYLSGKSSLPGKGFMLNVAGQSFPDYKTRIQNKETLPRTSKNGKLFPDGISTNSEKYSPLNWVI